MKRENLEIALVALLFVLGTACGWFALQPTYTRYGCFHPPGGNCVVTFDPTLSPSYMASTFGGLRIALPNGTQVAVTSLPVYYFQTAKLDNLNLSLATFGCFFLALLTVVWSHKVKPEARPA
jgi:hypothetical protein